MESTVIKNEGNLERERKREEEGTCGREFSEEI